MLYLPFQTENKTHRDEKHRAGGNDYNHRPKKRPEKTTPAEGEGNLWPGIGISSPNPLPLTD
jgi:hypothetical protein